MLTVSSLSVHAQEDPASDPITLPATVEELLIPSDRRLLPLSSRWFLECITCCMCITHEYYILKFDRTRGEMISFETHSNQDGIHLNL